MPGHRYDPDSDETDSDETESNGPVTPTSAERHFRAMGTDVSVIIVGGANPEALASRAQARIDVLEQLWSRFVPTSDVSRLNAADGAPVSVSDDTVLLVRTAIEAWRVSGGSVDCTELNALIEAGYDRSFDQLVDSPEDPTHSGAAPAQTRRSIRLVGPSDIRVDGTMITLPPDTGFDPGGIGKGFAADLVSAEMLAAGAQGICVNVGGDLRVSGPSPTGQGWTISIDHPFGLAPINLVGLFNGAIASSTVLRRTWVVDGERRHHLIDPGTGRPTESDIEFSTVIADTGWRAEVLTKAVLLRGGPHPFDLIEGTNAAALAVRRDGTIVTSSGWSAFTGGIEPTLIRDPRHDGAAENPGGK